MQHQKFLSSIDFKQAKRAHLTTYSESEDDSDESNDGNFTQEYYNLRPPPFKFSSEAKRTQNPRVTKDNELKQNDKRCETVRQPLASYNRKEQNHCNYLENNDAIKQPLLLYSSVVSKNLKDVQDKQAEDVISSNVSTINVNKYINSSNINKPVTSSTANNSQTMPVNGSNVNKDVSNSEVNKPLPIINFKISPEEKPKHSDKFKVFEGRFNINEQFKHSHFNSNVKLQLIDIQDLFNTNLNVSYFCKVKGDPKGNNLIKYLYITLIFIVNDILNAYFT